MGALLPSGLDSLLCPRSETCEDGKLGLEYEKDSGGGDLGTFQGAPGWGWQGDSAVGPPLWGALVCSNRKERSESPPSLRHLFRSRLN